jgi:hypothetical protein
MVGQAGGRFAPCMLVKPHLWADAAVVAWNIIDKTQMLQQYQIPMQDFSHT